MGIDWRDYLPTGTEQGPHVGFLSTFAEYHAIAVAFLIYHIEPALLIPIIAYGLGIGGYKSLRSGHARDAGMELAYVALGVGLEIAATNAGVV